MEQATDVLAAHPTVMDGTMTGMGRMPRSASVRLTVNRRWMVMGPSGLSDLFAGMRVRVHGEWHQGARRRYLVASQIEPLDPAPALPVERLSRALLGTMAPSEEQHQVVAVLSPALNWLWTAGAKAVAKKLARLSLRKAPQRVPTLAMEMIAIGEETGSLEPMLRDVAAFYEGHLDVRLTQLTTWIEPVLLLVMGVVVGTVVVIMYLPVFHMAGNIQ